MTEYYIIFKKGDFSGDKQEPFFTDKEAAIQEAEMQVQTCVGNVLEGLVGGHFEVRSTDGALDLLVHTTGKIEA